MGAEYWAWHVISKAEVVGWAFAQHSIQSIIVVGPRPNLLISSFSAYKGL